MDLGRCALVSWTPGIGLTLSCIHRLLLDRAFQCGEVTTLLLLSKTHTFLCAEPRKGVAPTRPTDLTESVPSASASWSVAATSWGAGCLADSRESPPSHRSP